MKKLLTTLCLVLLVSCSNEVPSDKLVERQGIKYEINSTTPFTGSSVSYKKNGQIYWRQNYKNGIEHGLYEMFSNGQLIRWGNYKEGIEHGPYEMFHENGQLSVRGNKKNGKPDGLWEGFSENGELEQRLTFKDGVIQD
jgi:antitoxin component YwqK of YwqJK toxin-antitoxin module